MSQGKIAYELLTMRKNQSYEKHLITVVKINQDSYQIRDYTKHKEQDGLIRRNLKQTVEYITLKEYELSSLDQAMLKRPRLRFIDGVYGGFEWFYSIEQDAFGIVGVEQSFKTKTQVLNWIKGINSNELFDK